MQRDDGIGAAMVAHYSKKDGEEALKETSSLKRRVSQLETTVDDLARYISRIEDRLYEIQGHGG